jgi:hypothetical protein
MGVEQLLVFAELTYRNNSHYLRDAEGWVHGSSLAYERSLEGTE